MDLFSIFSTEMDSERFAREGHFGFEASEGFPPGESD